MRLTLLLASVLVLAACGTNYIKNLPLQWSGVSRSPTPTTSVEQSLSSVPIALGDMRDSRADKTAVGTYDDGYIVRTNEDVARYCSKHFREILTSAGARIEGNPAAVIDSELLEYGVTEGGMFNGAVRIRITVARHGVAPWSKTYEGKSKRWGRTHNPENYNEALSNAFADATRKIVQDETFAKALLGQAPAPGTAPASSSGTGTQL